MSTSTWLWPGMMPTRNTAARPAPTPPRPACNACGISAELDTCGCRALDEWTIKLLQRKLSFVQARIQVMDGLEADVSACSIDGDCQFALRASTQIADASEELVRVLSGMAEVRLLATRCTPPRRLPRATRTTPEACGAEGWRSETAGDSAGR